MKENSISNIKAGVIITYITQFAGIALSLFYIPVMLGMLGQDEYGLYALVQSIVSYLQMSEMGIGITATRYNAKYLSEGDTEGQRSVNGMFALLYAGIALFCVFVGLVVYHFLPQWYSHYNTESVDLIKHLYLIALANLVITLLFKIYNSIVIAYERFIFIKVLSLVTTILGPVCMLFVLYMGYRSIGMLYVTTAIMLLTGLVQMYYCRVKLNVKFHFGNFPKGMFATVFSFTAFVFLNSIAHQLFSNSDKIIISLFMSEASIAVYAIVMQFQVYFYNFANVISGFFLPRFTKMVKGARNMTSDLMDEIIRVGRVQVIIAGLIFGGFVAIGHPFIIRWVGSEYNLAFYLAIFVSLCEFFASPQSMFNSLMQAMNLHRLRAVIGFMSSLVKIGLTILFVYLWGLWGCAIAYLIAFSIRLFAYNLYYIHVGINIRFFWKQILKLLAPIFTIITVLSGSFYWIENMIHANNYVIILLLALVYIVLFIFVLWKTCLNTYEKSLAINMISKIKRFAGK